MKNPNATQAHRLVDYMAVELEHGPEALVRRVGEDLGLSCTGEQMLILTTLIWVAHKAIVREDLDEDLDDEVHREVAPVPTQEN